jgi:E3 ubiquitin-protein ligase DOA10
MAMQKELNDCSICMCTKQETPDLPIVYLPCHGKHWFHEECWASWVQAKKNSRRDIDCPLCRAVVKESEVFVATKEILKQDTKEQRDQN